MQKKKYERNSCMKKIKITITFNTFFWFKFTAQLAFFKLKKNHVKLDSSTFEYTSKFDLFIC